MNSIVSEGSFFIDVFILGVYSKRFHQKPLDVAHHFIAEGNDREGFDLLKINDK